MNDVLRPTIQSVQRLARALTREPHGAEDIAQEAWLTALRKGVAAGSEGLEGWLAGAARRIARSSRRDEARRREREIRVGPVEPAAAAATTAARIEIVRRLVTEVERLEEPQRSAIVLRYFEDLPPRAIARRLGIPVNTARSRVRIGIERLRGRLDRATLLALAPLGLDGPARPAVGPGASVWIQAGAVVAAGVLLLGGVRWLGAIGGEPGIERLGLDSAEPAVPLENARLDAPVSPRDRVRESAPGPASESVVAGSASGAGVAKANGVVGHAEVLGRLVRPGGTPLVGSAVQLVQSRILMERLPASGLDGIRTESLATTTDEEGRFRFRLQPESYLGYGIALAEGGPTWDIPALRPGEVQDLGDLELELGGALLGRLLDGAGNPILTPGWEVYAEMLADGAGTGAVQGFSSVARPDPVTAEFRFDELPEGSFELAATHPLSPWIAGPRFEITASATTHADVVYAGPALEQRLRIDLRGSVRTGVLPDPRRILLRSASGVILHPTPVADTPWSMVFDGLAHGPHVLSIDDPRFQYWSRGGVEPGSVVVAELDGSAAFLFHVRDRSTGAAIESFVVRGRLVPGGHTELHLHDGMEALPAGLLEGIVPGSWRLSIAAEGYGRELVEMDALAPGETRVLSIGLGPGEWIEGVARREDGSPAAGVELAVFRSGAPSAAGARPAPLVSGRTDAAGAFRIQLPSAGEYRLVAGPGEHAREHAAPNGLALSLVEDQSLSGLQLVVP